MVGGVKLLHTFVGIYREKRKKNLKNHLPWKAVILIKTTSDSVDSSGFFNHVLWE